MDNTGGIAGPGTLPAFLAVLPAFGCPLSRTLACTVLARSAPAVLAALVASPGGADALAGWMLEALGEDSEAATGLLLEALAVLQKLPVSRAFVQATKCAKVVGALRKHDIADVRRQAKAVVSLWMRVVGTGTGGTGTR